MKNGQRAKMGLPGSFQVIGKRVPRVDAWKKVTGQEQYTEDIKLPDSLWGKILRSPHAHAIIREIDTSKAENVFGVKAVITFKDIPPYKIGYSTHADKYALCADKVRYVGDEIAAVAAVDEATAERAVSLIDVDYEVLQPVIDPIQAMRPNAPHLHEDRSSNICAEIHYEFGNTSKGFDDADHIFEDTFETQRQCHVCMELHGCVASWSKDGSLEVWTSTQIPHLLKRFLAKAYEIPFNKVRINKVGVGGAFGARTDLFPYDIIVACLSKKTGKPVKLILAREEEFAATVTRHPSLVTIKTGVKENKIITRQVKAILNAGAYAMQSGSVLGSLGWKGANYYRLKNYKFEGYAVLTNTAISSAYRGYGGPQLGFALESQIDIIAEKLNLDPVEFRLNNANREGDITISGNELRSCGLTECIQKVSKAIGWMNKKGRCKGKGIAIGFGESSWRGAYYDDSDVSAASVKMNMDGTVHVIVGGAEIGGGYDTAMAQIAAEALGVKFHHVSVHSGDTDMAAYDYGLYGDRGTLTSGAGVKLAAEEVYRELLRTGSELLGVPEQDLVLANEKLCVRKNPKKSVSIKEIAEHIYINKGLALIGKGTYSPETNLPDETGYVQPIGPAPAYIFGAVTLEVEIDQQTGQFKIDKVAAAVDCGKVVNPSSAEGQIEGDLHHGLGMATVERGLIYDESGMPYYKDLTDYKMLTSADMPPIDSILVESNDPVGPFGIKGISQITTSTVGAALANAIYDASGIRIKELPITPEKLLEAFKGRKLMPVKTE
jgi:CO/xanthine dehydrogenase Mo-binding subunit